MTSFATALVAAAAFLGAADSGTRVPVILDTDIGDDIDDTWALAMILGMPEFDLKLITTAFSDTSAKTRLTAKILQQVGRTDIPIGTGPRTQGHAMNQLRWLGDYDLKAYPGKVYEDGVQAMIDTIKSSSEPVTLIVIGPQMNVAEALKRDPSIATNARVVSMAGSVRVGYDGAPKPQPEWNVKCDPAAVQAVFAAPWDITLAPLDICGTLRLTGSDYAAVKESNSPLAKVVIENYELWSNRHRHAKDSSSILFDTVAVYLALTDELCTMETVKLVVSDKGETLEDPSGRDTHCAMSWKDEQAFKDLLVKVLTK